MEPEMKAKLTINRPQSLVEGWTGYVTNPVTGEKITLTDFCGGCPVSFSTRDALIKAARRAIARWAQ